MLVCWEFDLFVVPDQFAQFMIELYGTEGLAWLDRLPAILAACEQRWGLRIGLPFAQLSYHYVTPAVRAEGTPVVLKVGPPGGEFRQQIEALRLFDGHGMVQLLAYDEDDEVMLLERLEPGTLLSTLHNDEEATSIAASVMRQLWRPAPANHLFPTVSDWGKGFMRLRQHYGGGNGPFPAALLDKAETLFAELSASMAEPALLHGDLHHDNILAARCEPWLAIDPKGLIGEPAYETGALLRNQLSLILKASNPGRALARRVDQLAAELGFERPRVRGWGLSQAVLSAWWDIEDSGSISEDTIRCAELLAAIKV
jgi:streptomycin 6-kinase